MNRLRTALCGLVLALTLGPPATAVSAARPAPAPAARIVSLMPSLTEDLFAIGAGPRVVAVSQFSDHPPAALRLPQVASFAAVDAERIVRLHPDLVVGITAQAALVRDVQRLGTRVELLPDDSYDDIFRSLRRLGTLTGRDGAALHTIDRLKATTEGLERRVRAGERPRVFVVLQTAPIFTIGDRSYIATLLGLAGARNAAGDIGSAYGRFDAEALLARDPDAIVADPASGIASVLDRAPWNALRAVKSHRVYILRDAGILERPGPRYNDGIAWLIARLHPAARA